MKRSPLKRKTRIRQRSAKRIETMRRRRDLVARLLLERPGCEAFPLVSAAWNDHPEHHVAYARALGGCKHASTDVHEPRTRARYPGAETILDEGNCLCVCWACHDFIHSNNDAAEAAGLLAPSATPTESTPPQCRDGAKGTG